MQYCENCGNPLDAQARFCARCGQVVSPASDPITAKQDAPTPPQPAEPQQAAEKIVAALPAGTQRSGFLGLKFENFVLVLTNKHILVAKQTSQMMKENVRQAKQAAKQSGSGFFGQWGAVIGSNSSQRYLQMHPQEILNETAGNYSIANNQIRSVQIKENFDHEDANSEVKLTLKLVSGKIQLTYTRTSKNEIKQILQQTLGDLVR